ncbi:MAG: IS1380 family transposase [Acidimicrobiia bacterium]
MKNVEHRSSSVVVRADDPSVTGSAGMVCVTEAVRALGLIEAIDAFVGPIKRRRRGLSAGEFVVSLAECLLGGGDFLADLDRARQDTAGAALRCVPVPAASTTARTLAQRFGPDELAGIEAAWVETAARALELCQPSERGRLCAQRPTIDLDSTEIEVFGRHKQGVAYNYLGQLAGRVLLGTWAEAGVALAATTMAGNDDPRPAAPDVVSAAIGGLPAGLGRPRVRMDSGFFDRTIIDAVLAAETDVCVAAPRNPAVVRAWQAIDGNAWRPAIGMHDAEVAEANYTPGGWPAMRCIVRRVRHPAERISTDPRARRRRTLDKAQLQLVLDGKADTAYGYSALLTTLDGDCVDIEAWFRGRVAIEDRFRDAKLGYGLRHLPSGDPAINHLWVAAALTAMNLAALTQLLAGQHRRHAKRFRHDWLRVPGRVLHHARRTILRLPATATDLVAAHTRLAALPGPSG